MTKHLTNNSVLKRASLFENRNLEQSTSSNSQRDVSSIVASAALAAASNNNNSKEVDLFQDSIKGNLNTFKKEYLQLYPNNKLPFLELHSLEETKQLNTTLQNRIKELRNELSRTEFVTTFLDEILARNEDNSAAIASNNNNKAGDNSNLAKKEEEPEKSDAIVSKEQYVTVITLNDNTYGEIQKQKSSPKSIISVVETNPATPVNGKDSTSVEKNSEKPSHKAEPIYLNTLESNKTQEKVAKKRPPTPPRKPKFNNASLKLKGNESSKTEDQPNKSASLGSMQQRKFSGPTHRIEENFTKKSNEQNKTENVASVAKSNSDSNKDGSKHSFLRTFSVEQQQHSVQKLAKFEDQTIHESESSLFKDYDNIYDTVTVDSDCDNLSTKDDEISSHEMLSRCSSTEEGLSNYVNIDYFLRKNSLGRSNSNLPSKLMKYPYGEDEPEDNETTLSSMKSSDYEFSSNENLLNSLQPSGTDSLNSMSQKSSAGVSSLRTPRLKPLNTELASSYPPNLSTFTPTPQDRNRLLFASKDDSPASEPSSILHKDSSTESLKKIGYESTSEYYAITDILKSLPKEEFKTLEANPSNDLVAKHLERDDPEQSLLNMKNNIIKSIIESVW